MRRRLFTFVSVLSLMLCAATAALWVRSYYVFDGVPILRWHSVGAESLVGAAAVHWTANNNPTANKLPRRASHFSIKGKSYLERGFNTAGMRWHFAGFGFLSADLPFGNGVTIKARGLSVPYWFLMGCAAFLPTLRGVVRIRRHDKLAIARCRTCGYDLTGNVSGVCPECGTAIDPNSTPPQNQDNSS